MTDSPSSLLGSTAVVTGASRGIGRAISLRLAAAGADVLVHARSSRQELEETAAQIRSLGRQSHLLLADLEQHAEQDRLAAEAWQWRGKVDIWVNNAGVDLLTGPATKWTFDEKLEKAWRIDVVSSVRLGRAVGRRMRDAGKGSIVNVGWDQAERGMAGDSGELFAASKGAIMAFTRSLAESLAPKVRVNCVAPGWIRTAWGETASEYWQQRAIAESLLARWGTPEDIAGAVEFLVSPAASFITGQILNVNGGLRRTSATPLPKSSSTI